VNLGDTFFNLPDGTGYPNHLWFVISNPTGAEKVVIVNIPSDDEGYGDLPVLARNDHPWMTHDSYIRTDFASLYPVRVLREKLSWGELDAKQPVSTAVLRKIQRGVYDSRHTEREIKLVLHDQELI
jgi:hypothetical protein